MGFLHFCLRTDITLLVKYTIVLHSDGHGTKIMLKCGILAVFLDFENGCCYLNTIARKRKKTYGFLAFLLKNIHYFIGLNTSLFYIRMVMEEKLS